VPRGNRFGNAGGVVAAQIVEQDDISLCSMI